jgi:hypothetical protein
VNLREILLKKKSQKTGQVIEPIEIMTIRTIKKIMPAGSNVNVFFMTDYNTSSRKVK